MTTAHPHPHAPQPEAAADENKLVTERREKLAALRAQHQAAGTAVFPNDFKPSHHASALQQQYGALDNDALEPQAVAVVLAGRMVLKRVMGKASFATLQDGSFSDATVGQQGRIQLFISRDALGEAAYDAFKHSDLGDILGASGTLFKTRTGELSVKVTALRLLTKSLRPLPDKFHGMADQEQKYRQRYVDLIADEAARVRFVARSKAVSLDPQLHGRARLPGGGNADAAPDPGWCQRPALHHPPQRAGPADVPAHRARALPQAPAGGRLRAGVRDQPQLPQRRHQRPPQPRIHDDGVLCGLLDAP